MRSQVLHLLVCRPAQQLGRIPARDESEPEAFEHSGKRFRFTWKFVSKLDAGEPGFFCFRETDLKRCRTAKLTHVVIRPADRIRADADHVQSPSRCALSAVS